MKKRFVITNLPAKLPVTNTALVAFLLYYFKAHGFIWGIFITVYSIIWIAIIIMKSREQNIDVDLFKIMVPKKDEDE